MGVHGLGGYHGQAEEYQSKRLLHGELWDTIRLLPCSSGHPSSAQVLLLTVLLDLCILLVLRCSHAGPEAFGLLFCHEKAVVLTAVLPSAVVLSIKRFI